MGVARVLSFCGAENQQNVFRKPVPCASRELTTIRRLLCRACGRGKPVGPVFFKVSSSFSIGAWPAVLAGLRFRVCICGAGGAARHSSVRRSFDSMGCFNEVLGWSLVRPTLAKYPGASMMWNVLPHFGYKMV